MKGKRYFLASFVQAYTFGLDPTHCFMNEASDSASVGKWVICQRRYFRGKQTSPVLMGDTVCECE